MTGSAFGDDVRTLQRLELAAGGRTLTEAGLWEGRWHTRAGPLVQRGRYEAERLLTPVGWRITLERYTTRSA